MNTLTTAAMTDPYDKISECIQFTIDELSDPFVLDGIMTIGRQYTFSCWCKVDGARPSPENIIYLPVVNNGSKISFGDEWAKIEYSFVAASTSLLIIFQAPGTYYIYHPQLELGTMATDWTPAPEDTDDRFVTTDQAISDNRDAIDDANNRVSLAEASLQVLADSVVTLATDDDGNTSVLQQKGTGWMFSLGNLENTISDALDALAQLTEGQDATQLAIDSLKRSVADHAALQDYVVVTEYNGQPCIELGEIGGEFKLRITNTEMYFMAGSMILTTVTNKKMIAEKIEIRDELQQGSFVWKTRSNGNLGLTRIGGN